MKKRFFALLLSIAPIAGVAADGLLIRQGENVVTSRDVERAIESFVPEQHRAELYANERRLRDFIAQQFAVRVLANEARSRELTPDESWKIDNSAERTAAQVQLAHVVDQLPKPDFTAAAHEFYVANPEQFVRPEQVEAQHILISTKDRGKEDALKLARHVMALAQKGDQDFEKLAEEFSDDSSGKNGGSLGWFERGRMVAPFEQAAFSLQKPGELAGPVETEFGYHVIRLLGHRPAGVEPFDSVKEALIRNEEASFRRAAVGREYERVGKLPGIETNQEAIRALVRPIDFKAHRHQPAE